MQLTRRTLLATGSLLGLGGIAGYLGVELFDRKPLLLRATPATRGAIEDTDAQCRLSERVVSNHSKLQHVLRQAQGNQPGEWARTGITESRASAIYDALVSHCGENDVRGIYRYDGEWFYISMSYRQARDHDHGGHDHSTETHGGHDHSTATHGGHDHNH